METKNDIYKLITRKLLGSSSDEEKSLLDKNLKDNEKLADEYKIFDRFWKMGHVAEDQESVDNIYKNVINSIYNLKVKRQKKLINWLTGAASVLVIISVSMFYMINKGLEVIDTIRYATKIGEVKEVTLPDSSKVILNSSSILFFPESFADQSRDVFLVGEASFDISKDNSKPFRVETSHVEIEVLGTEFLLSAYQDDLTISTYLKEGSVKINGDFTNEEDYTMIPNQKVIVTKSTMKLEVENDVPLLNNWVNGYIAFEELPLSSILPKLERKFGVQFIVMDQAVNDYVFTGRFKDESVFKILGYLSATKPFDYELKDDLIVISIEEK